MLSPETVALIPAWKARKDAQWERISDRMPGIQLVRSREQRTQYMLTCSTDAFYESIIVGQLPEVVMEAVGSRLNPRRAPMAEDKKPHDKRGIDLTDDQIDAVLAQWQLGRSALGLSFVAAVWGRDGAVRLKTP